MGYFVLKFIYYYFHYRFDVFIISLNCYYIWKYNMWLNNWAITRYWYMTCELIDIGWLDLTLSFYIQ